MLHRSSLPQAPQTVNATEPLLPSLGSVGALYDNAMVESFWARMQTELLDRQRWRTRVELANAIFEYIEGLSQPTTPALSPRLAKPHRLREHRHPPDTVSLHPGPAKWGMINGVRETGGSSMTASRCRGL
jgi:hypothetical protein